jgi:hypothetical protein
MNKKLVINGLNTFPFDYKRYKAKRFKAKLLSTDLKEHLCKELPDFVWETEHKPSDSCNDRVDIFGVSKETDFKIVIELDPHRADQVAKKFLSRTVLFLYDNVLYVSLCYPGTKNMPINECKKYFKYCNILSEFLTKISNKQKLYIGAMYLKTKNKFNLEIFDPSRNSSLE